MADPAGTPRWGVFGYGSLALPESVAMTLGRVPDAAPAALREWKRRFSIARDNLTCEKTFEIAGGHRPPWILGLNVEPGEDPAGPVNGAVIELTEAELDRLDVREMRYDRTEVTGLVDGEDLPERIVTYKAKRRHFSPEPPPGAIIIANYVRTVEAAFDALGPGELDRYLATTGEYPVERVEATLVIDRIPEGNPRAW